MPFYFHPDIKTYHFQASFLSQGVFDIYKYLDAHKKEVPLKEEFVYFPLTYFFLGGYQVIASPFLGSGFQSWVADASSQTYGQTVGIYRYLFILKLPYLALDIGMAFLLMRFFENPEQKRKVFTLWLFNPFTIILIYIFGNIDIIPVFLTTIGLLLARKNKLVWSGVILGIATGFKAYPLLFLPFLLLFSKNLKQVLLTSLATFATLGVILLPFMSSSFQNAALVSGLTTRIFYPGVSIGFGETLMAAVISLSALFFFSHLNKRGSTDNIWKYYLSLLLLLYSFIHFHIQWLLWAAPFLVLLVTYNIRYKLIALSLAILAFLIPLLYEDKSMSVSLLQAYSNLYNLLPIPISFVEKIYDPYVVQSIIHSTIIGASLVLVWQLFKEEKI